MSRTVAELTLAVLREMNVLDASESTPDTEDSTYIAQLYADKFEELNDMELTYWSSDEIPNPIFLAVRDLIINEARGTYGTPQAPEDKEAREALILKRIRRHMHKRSSGLSVWTRYF